MAGKRWNGSSFVDLSTTRKRWNGSSWVDLVTAKRWNGTVWIDLFPDSPPVDPSLPTASWVGGNSASDYYFCQNDLDNPPNTCTLLHEFTLVKTFTSSGATSITFKPTTGVSASIVGSTVTFTSSVARGADGLERTPTLLFTNSFGTLELPFSWVLTYEYDVIGGEPL